MTEKFKGLSETVKPVKKFLVFENKNGKVYCDENFLITFQAFYNGDETIKNKFITQITELEKQIEKEQEIEVSQDLKAQLRALEKQVEFFSGGFSWGKYKTRLENRKQLDDFLSCLAEGQDPDNIRSCLANTGLTFGSRKRNNNLEAILTDEELDEMTIAQATSYDEEWKNRYPWTRVKKTERA